jgi:hypothetical protein
VKLYSRLPLLIGKPNLSYIIILSCDNIKLLSEIVIAWSYSCLSVEKNKILYAFVVNGIFKAERILPCDENIDGILKNDI